MELEKNEYEEEAMIQRGKFKINYIKKERQSGSYQGMRFTFQAEDDQLNVIFYPEPYCLEKTPDGLKESAQFALSDQGLDEAVDWLNDRYKEREAYWLEAYANRMKG